MPRIEFIGGYGGAPARNDCAACSSDSPRYYDEMAELHFCDLQCYADWIAMNSDEVAKEMAERRLYEISED